MDRCRAMVGSVAGKGALRAVMPVWLQGLCLAASFLGAPTAFASGEVDWTNLQRCTVKILGVQEIGLINVVSSTGIVTTFGVPDVGHGSGVIWKTGELGTFIITNRHVVEGTFGLAVGVQGTDELFPARVLHASSETDLAVVVIDATLPDSVCKPAYAGGMAGLGDGVRVFGYAMDATAGEAKMSAGIVSRKVDELIEVDAAMNPGNSGGPAFDEKGGIIGIAVAKLKEAEGMNFIIPAEKIDGVLLAVQNKEIDDWKAIRGSDYWEVYKDVCKGLKHVSLSTYTPEELLLKTLRDEFVSAAEAIVAWLKSGKKEMTGYETPQLMVLAAAVTFNQATLQKIEAKIADDSSEASKSSEKLQLVDDLISKAVALDERLKKWTFVEYVLGLNLGKKSAGPVIIKAVDKKKEKKKKERRTGHASSLKLFTGVSKFTVAMGSHGIAEPGAVLGLGHAFVFKPYRHNKFQIDIIIEPAFEASFGDRQGYWAVGGTIGLGAGMSFVDFFYFNGGWCPYAWATNFKEDLPVSAKGFFASAGFILKYVEIEVTYRAQEMGTVSCAQFGSGCRYLEPFTIGVHHVSVGLRFARW
jgi:S1-C subfamily serine protease